MGSQQSKSKPKEIGTIDGSWSKISQHKNGLTYRNQDGRQGNLYSYILQNNYDAESQEVLIEQRAQKDLPLVKPYTCEIKNTGGFLKPENNFEVMTERIRLLAECPQLSFQQILYTLSQSLKGYQYLYDQVGPFYINNNMLGFNNEGKLKVWLNQNFGMNHPSHPQNILMSTVDINNFNVEKPKKIRGEQASMVRNICNVIEDKCQQGRFPQFFEQQIHQQGIGFLQAEKIIQDIAARQSIYVPSYVDLYRNTIMVKSPRMTINQNPHPKVFPKINETRSSQVFPR